ncbi:dephospho-CoA kinase [Clostridia bacterium]|nr:dephospho-CoA kinase [Clostridia bacterium]
MTIGLTIGLTSGLTIGLTGGSGSGKTTLCRAARDMGMFVIDADKVGHGVLLKGRPAYDETVAAFGDGILGSDGEIDRRRLGVIVFADPEKLALLSGITHKEITREIEGMLVARGGDAVIDAAALIESGLGGRCDYVVAVVADDALRRARIVARDGLTPQAAQTRIAAQKSAAFYRSNAHYVIENNGDEAAFYDRGSELFRRLVGREKD